ncbi:LPXTG cell wall anchor domain-containing protein [Enterococcus faecalis]
MTVLSKSSSKARVFLNTGEKISYILTFIGVMILAILFFLLKLKTKEII